MTNQPSTKIPFRDIKDHADLMEYFVGLIRTITRVEIHGWNKVREDEIRYLKAEIAHFMRIQSAQPGVAFDDENNDPLRNSGGYAKGTKL